MIGMIWTNEFVVVGGISQKGKNRIHEHGSVWRVRQVDDNHGILLESTDSTFYLRWVDHKDDADFDLIRIVNPDTLENL